MSSYRTFKIGRDPGNDFVLTNPTISRFHVEVFINEEAVVFITDLNSSNGTFINGNRLKGTTILNPGDILKLGSERPIRWQDWTRPPINSDESNLNNKNSILDMSYPPEKNHFQKYWFHWLFSLLVFILAVLIYVMFM